MIRYIKHSEIEKNLWDKTVESSVNSIIYGYSWYLDVVSPGWDCLVYGDYDVVFPLTWNKKYGIKYLDSR
jgi:hypothetical protein